MAYESFSNLIIHVGTNDLVHKPAEAVVGDLENLVMKFKGCTNNIAISSVIMRNDGRVNPEKILLLNQEVYEQISASDEGKSLSCDVGSSPRSCNIHDKEAMSLENLLSEFSGTAPVMNNTCMLDIISEINSQSTCDKSPSNYDPVSNIKALKGFKIAALNIASLVSHIDELKMVMSSQTLDILAINETRLDSTIAHKDISIIGYNVVRKDRNRHGGGVLLYVKETWNFLTKQITSDIDLEILTIEIIGKFVKPFLVTTWYRPPASELNVLDTFETYLQSLEMEEKESIIL
ncbi:RNA-directed DNA polymerase from transposon BS, partial [Paramuricea clavata]